MMELRSFLRGEGIRCSVINVTRHRQEEHDDLYFPASGREVLSRLDALNPDVVHVHFGGSLFMRQAALFVLLSLRPRTANVFTFHSGGFPGSEEGQSARWFSARGFALRRLDAIIGVNQELVNTFLRYGARRSRVHLIAPFAPLLDLQAIRAEVIPAELEQFVHEHDPFFLSVAQLEPEYGLDVQISAFQSIRARYPRAGLMLLGGGTLHESLANQIASIPDSAHVLLAGNVPRPKTLALIARADLLLRTTHYDGDALSIREALSIGTPVLATNNGMRPDGVALLSALNPDALADEIPEALGVNGVSTQVKLPSTHNPVRQVLELYETLLKS